MLKNILIVLAAFLFVLPAKADISLRNAELSNAFLVIQSDETRLKGTLAEKKNLEGKQRAAQIEKVNGYLKIEETLHGLLPPEAVGTQRLLFSVGSDLKTSEEFVACWAGGKIPFDKLNIIGAVSYDASIRMLFDAVGMFPLVKPEVTQTVQITPIKLEGYPGYRFVDNKNQDIVIECVISENGKTLLFGDPATLKAQLAKPQEFGPDVNIPLLETQDCAGSFILVIPDGFRAELQESLAASEMEESLKSALGGLRSVIGTFSSNADSVSLQFKGLFRGKTSAETVKTELLEKQIIPLAKQIFAGMEERGFTFHNTFAATQKGAVAGIGFSMKESDLDAFIDLLGVTEMTDTPEITETPEDEDE